LERIPLSILTFYIPNLPSYSIKEIQAGGYSLAINLSEQTKPFFRLLPSRLYCRLWNLTTSACARGLIWLRYFTLI